MLPRLPVYVEAIGSDRWRTWGSRLLPDPQTGGAGLLERRQKLGPSSTSSPSPTSTSSTGSSSTPASSPGGHRFVDAPEVEEIYERGVVLKIDAAEAEGLPEPSANPGALEVDADDVPPGGLSGKLQRAWDLISGND